MWHASFFMMGFLHKERRDSLRHKTLAYQLWQIWIPAIFKALSMCMVENFKQELAHRRRCCCCATHCVFGWTWE